MRFPPYAVYTLLGSLLWCLGFAGAGLAVGEGWESFHEKSRYADYVIVALVVLAAGYVGFKLWRRRVRRRAVGVSDRAR